MKNVILLTIDTLRKDVLGCYGGGNLSPFIDSIQDHCIKFNRAHSPGPYTQAAFPGILTSSYRLEYGRGRMLSEKSTLMSEVLQKAGVTTAGFHSNPELSAYFGWNRGWDFFYDSMEVEIDQVDPKAPYVKAGVLNKKVATWVSSHVETGGQYKPFFLWLHYMDVHEPYVPERKYVDIVDPSIDLDPEEMFRLYNDVLFKRDVSDKGIVELLKKLYCTHVREVDDGVREFFGILEKLKILRDTAIIITSDHGDEFGEHGGLSHDGKMYSELVNVPLMIYDASREKEEVCDIVVSTIDLAPTIVHLFGLEQVDAFEGHSLFPLEGYPAEGVFGEAVDKQGSKEKGDEREVHYYCEGDLKIMYRETDDSWELYNLRKDPKEVNNIADKSPVAETMKNKVRPRVRRYERVSLQREISEKRKRQCAKLVEISKDIVRQAFDRVEQGELGITWTGGKDSTLTLWIIRQVCQEKGIPLPKSMIIGEGDEFEEIEEFVEKTKKEWNVPLEMCRNDDVLKAANHTLNAPVKVTDLNERNQAELRRIGFDREEFPFEAESYVGNHLMKTVVFNGFLERKNIKGIFQGLRWDEHPARFNDEYFEYKEADHLVPEHTRIRPILHFTEKDLWDTYAAFMIPHCALYERGYRSLGAKTTTVKNSDIPAWEQDLESTEERVGRRQDKEKTMDRLRKLGYM